MKYRDSNKGIVICLLWMKCSDNILNLLYSTYFTVSLIDCGSFTIFSLDKGKEG